MDRVFKYVVLISAMCPLFIMLFSCVGVCYFSFCFFVVLALLFVMCSCAMFDLCVFECVFLCWCVYAFSVLLLLVVCGLCICVLVCCCLYVVCVCVLPALLLALCRLLWLFGLMCFSVFAFAFSSYVALCVGFCL